MRTRKAIRLSGYDYSRPNAFFITICCDQHRHLFGPITNGMIHLNAYGHFAHDQWLALAAAYPHIDLGEFVIMPNHMHGVIYLGEWDAADGGDGGHGDGRNGGNGRARDTAGGDDGRNAGDVDGDDKAGGGKPLPYEINDDGGVWEGLTPARDIAPPPTLSAIIGAYKSLTYRDCMALANTNNECLGKLWHRSFYEIIIRTPEAARRIRHYIRNNVQTWARDKFHGG
ncbi:transposase [Neolewinella persica]|uniref:transposase n=1 Tax=Neolewinella persica TaxID=70998 RepID=UPI0012FB8C1B|nr:transposase [Neolewinella persica]